MQKVKSYLLDYIFIKKLRFLFTTINIKAKYLKF